MEALKKLVPQKIRNIYHLFQAVLANLIYGSPTKKLKVIGVTGTNGKTTTVQMIAKILEEADKKAAVISTINFKLGKKEWVNKTKFTTLSSFKVQNFARKAVKAGCQYLILEVSSHSIDQNRIWGIDFNTAVITNITREHLDYHKTIEKYRRTKLKLLKSAEAAIINLDMERPEEFSNPGNKKTVTYSTENPKADVYAEDMELGIKDTRYRVKNTNFNIKLPGIFNVENTLAAITVGLSQGVNLQTISEALSKIENIPGRLECVPNNKGLKIIIDYALTPDSLTKLYNYLRDLKGEGSRIISVFGSCGERDRGKRPIMGKIVSKTADLIILTNEDPYHEDPWRIINEIEEGIKNKIESKNYWKIMDRRKAIKKAIGLARPRDIIVVTGKGAEETMAVGKKIIPWNDKRVIQEILLELS